MTAITTEKVTPEVTAVKKSWVLLTAGILALTVGFGAVAGGVFGAWFTWDQAVVQDVTTPSDAAIPDAAVRGPFTMWAQADIINHHQLDRTDGLYYSQMDRQVPLLDETGEPVLEDGEQVMVPNEERLSWINATALTTALSLGILSYALSAMAVAVGLTLMATGFVFLYIRKRAVLL